LKNPKSDIHFLEDMILGMQRIRDDVSGMDRESFKTDFRTIDAVVRNLDIVGVAGSHISEEIKAESRQIPWDKIIRLRSRIKNKDFIVDHEIIWNIVTKDLPENLKQLKKLYVEKKNRSS
jgi:uncharacterized protein with HEPN domain